MGKAIFSPNAPELEAKGALLAMDFFLSRPFMSAKMVMMIADVFFGRYTRTNRRSEVANGFVSMALIIAKGRLND